MIKGFEEFTIELNEKDIPAVDLIIKGLNAHVGKEKAVSNAKIRSVLKNNYYIKLSDAKVRKIIQYIRQENRVKRLCSNSSGYYVAKNKQEFLDWTTSMEQRIRSMQYTLTCVVTQNPML